MPGETAESVLAGIRTVVEPLGVAPRPSRCSLCSCTRESGLTVTAFYPGWLLPESDPLLAAGKATGAALFGAEPGVGVWRFSTDGTYSAGAAGIPSLGFGPEEEQYVHTALDQVSLTKLRKAAAFYALFPFLYGSIDG